VFAVVALGYAATSATYALATRRLGTTEAPRNRPRMAGR
jgi:hypothetical protein